jgi:hypothetical protein
VHTFRNRFDIDGVAGALRQLEIGYHP